MTTQHLGPTFQPAHPAPRPPAPAAPFQSCTAKPDEYTPGLKGVRWRLRNHRVPPLAMATLATAAETAHLLGPWTGPAWAVAASAGIYGVPAIVAWRKAENQVKTNLRQRGSFNRKDWRRIARRRHYQLTATGAGATWLAWTWADLGAQALTGWTGVAFVGLSGLLFLTHSLRYGLPTPAVVRPATAPSTELVDDVAGRLKAALEDFFVQRGQALAYAGIEKWENIDAGGRVMLSLVKGKHDIGTVRQLTEKLKVALRCHDVTVDFAEPGPGGDPGLVWITALTRTEVARKEQLWERPGLEPDGQCRIGGYLDGTGETRVRVFVDNGMYNGFVPADTGKGKSQVLKNVAISLAAGPEDPSLAATYGGCVRVHLDDGDGSSEPSLHESSLIRAKGHDEIHFFYEQIAMPLIRGRRLENQQNRWKGFNAYNQGRPAWLIMHDEFHITTNRCPTCKKHMELVVREGRKFGIALWGATQDVTLNAFANSEVLRSQMCQNVVCLYSQSANAAQRIPNLPINPQRLRPEPGYHAVGPHGRPMQARTYLADDDLLDRYPTASPSAVDLGAIGQAFRDYVDSQADADAYNARKFAALQAGEPEPEPYLRPWMRPTTPDTAAPATPVIAAVHQAGETPERAPAAAPAKSSAILRLVADCPSFLDPAPTAPPAAVTPAVSETPSASDLGLVAKDAVLLLLGEDVNRAGDMERASGFSDTWIRKACEQLVELKLLEPKTSKHDPWIPTARGWMAIGQAQVAHAEAGKKLLRRIS